MYPRFDGKRVATATSPAVNTFAYDHTTFTMPRSMVFRFLVPAEATAFIVGENGVTKEFPNAFITVADEGELIDRIICISGDQNHGNAACQMIIQRLYEAQDVASGDRGIFVLLVPATLSEDVLETARDISGAHIHLEPDAIPGDERALQIEGSYQETVTAVFHLAALIESNQHFEQNSQEITNLSAEGAYGAFFEAPEGFEKREADPVAENARHSLQEPEEAPTESTTGSNRFLAGHGRPSDAKQFTGQDEVLKEVAGNREEEILSEPLEEDPEIEFLHETEAADTADFRKIPTSACFAVSSSVAAWVVGRKGQSIKSLRDRSKAMIEVSNDARAYRLIEINADQDAVMLAIQLLLEQMSSLPDGSPELIRMVLPPNSAGFVIGRGGESIKDLRRRSGAEMDLDRSDAGDGRALLKISGSLEEMTKAAQLVVQHLVDGRFSKPKSDIDQLKALLTESTQLQASLTMLIPAHAVNRVPKARLSHVERLTGSAIKVDGLGGRTSGVQQLQIMGTKNANAMAILHLQEIFKEHLQS